MCRFPGRRPPEKRRGCFPSISRLLTRFSAFTCRARPRPSAFRRGATKQCSSIVSVCYDQAGLRYWDEEAEATGKDHYMHRMPSFLSRWVGKQNGESSGVQKVKSQPSLFNIRLVPGSSFPGPFPFHGNNGNGECGIYMYVVEQI